MFFLKKLSHNKTLLLQKFHKRKISYIKKDIDFLKSSFPDTIEKPFANKEPSKKKYIIYVVIFFILAIVGFSSRIIISSTEATKSFGGVGILSQLKNLFIKQEQDIAGIKDDRVNILLLGIGGDGHEGPYLTDTIIIASLQPKKQRGALISIPRDLYAQTNLFGGTKINAIYTLAKASGRGDAPKITKQTFSEILGIPIHYYAIINFDGFVKFIDTLDGIDVTVEESFTDPEYPAKNFTTKTVSFEKGLQHLNGERALQFARSRHGTNGEGSDFARAKRQQKILLATKEKLLKRGMLLNPNKMNKIIEAIGESIETDMEIWEAVKLAKISKELQSSSITTKVIDDGEGGALYATLGIDGAFLLIPKDVREFQSIIQNIFEIYDFQKEQAKIVIQNGTKTPGLARTTSLKLEEVGFSIIRIDNAAKQSYVKTVIFDLSYGTKSTTLAYLKENLGANVSSYVPVELWRENQGADFVIILGEP